MEHIRPSIYGLGSATAQAKSSTIYIPSPEKEDVLREQFERLMEHDSAFCSLDCRNCRRLAHIKHFLLLKPFDDEPIPDWPFASKRREK